MNDLFLGLDSSTQGLTATIIDYTAKKVVYEKSINFEETFKDKYKVKNGVLENFNNLIVHAPPLMWIEAIDVLFTKIKNDGFDFSKIKAVSGSGQQHGSVYLNENFSGYLKKLENAKSLLENIENIFTRETSPVWMDSSTEEECEEIRNAIGGTESTVMLTGSDTFARFTGPQIRKFYKEEKLSYDKTKCIHLVSSFLSSVLSGSNSPIDTGDGAGMNLMDITKLEWSEKALSATADNLKEKLPIIVSSETIIGTLNPYFVKKYGFDKNCETIVWSGDNPNSLIGVGLIREGQAAFSLGTSDVYYSLMKNIKFNKNGEGHIFTSPNGDYMTLLVFKNGSLAREKVCENYGLSWEDFSNILKNTAAGNNGRIMLPYFFPEIIPTITKPEVVRYGFYEKDINANVRGIVEGQMLSSRLHSEWMGIKTDTIYATGGASKNKEILKIMANVHKANVFSFKVTNSASLGAALRAAYSFNNQKKSTSWQETIDGFILIDEKNVIKPKDDEMKIYDELIKIYSEKEKEFLKNN
jgi:xylulokinase